MDELLRDAAERATQYLGELQERRVAPSDADLAQLAELGGDLPGGPMADGEILALLDRVGSPATMASAGPRYFGFVTGGALPVTVATNVLAGAWDQNALSPVASPVGAELERITLGWLVDVLGLPPGSYGALVTGTQLANFCALAAARHALLARSGWDVEGKGLNGAPSIRIVAGAEAHATLLRAVSLVGLGSDNIELVEVDGQGRMRADALPMLDDRTVLCIQAGNVNSGGSIPQGHSVLQRDERTRGCMLMELSGSGRARHRTGLIWRRASSWRTLGRRMPTSGSTPRMTPVSCCSASRSTSPQRCR